MWGILNLRKARAAAMATVPVFINHTKRHYDTRVISLEVPFVAGFVTVFITNVALERVQNLSENILGLIQAEVWATLLNETREHIGEQISFQSVLAEPAFLFGCVNARYFCSDLFSAIEISELEMLAQKFCTNGECEEIYFNELCCGNARREHILQNWSHRFETFL